MLGSKIMAPSFQMILFAILSFSLRGLVASTSNVTDAESLLAFKSKITSDPQGALNSWNLKTHPNVCSWGNIACSTAGRVTNLTLNTLSLVGELSPELGNLTSLQSLVLDFNTLSGPLPESFGQLKNLEILSLYSCGVSGSLFPSLFRLPSLLHINLTQNFLNGSIPQEVGLFPGTKLYLDSNNLTGEIPVEIGNMKNIGEIVLSSNPLSGPLPASFSLLNKTLITLAISHTSISGSIPASFGNLFIGTPLPSYGTSYSIPSVGVPGTLLLSNNQLSGQIPNEISQLGINIQWLDLSHNQLTGSFPSAIGNLTELINLFLQGNLLTGAIPNIFSKLTYLQAFDVSNNFLSGPIPKSLFANPKCALSQVILSQNLLTGSLPGGLENCPNLVQVSLQLNRLSGPFPNVTSALMTIFELGVNRFYGPLPASLSTLSQLTSFDVNSNLFNGSVPPSLFTLPLLNSIDLSRNQFNKEFTGPAVHNKVSPVVILDLSFNSIPGPIPASLALMNTTLTLLKLANNKFSGPISPELTSLGYLQYLSAPSNNISGPLPDSLSGLTSIQYIDLSNNNLAGPLPSSVGLLRSLHTLNLTGNSLNSSLPDTIGNLTRLSVLNVASNLLSGALPDSMGKLTALSILDLSVNFFSGAIPATFSSLSGLSFFNISSNHLSGAIPAGNLSKFNSSSYLADPALCGGPLAPCAVPVVESSSSLKTWQIVVIAVAAALAVLLVCACAALFMWRGYNSWEDGEFFLFQKVGAPLTMRIILDATDNFSPKNILGQGGFGAVYKVTLKDGTDLAVKRLFEGAGQGLLEVQNEMRTLGKVRHKNLVTLIGAFIGKKEALLIYEFLSGGDLEKRLFDSVDSDGNLKKKKGTDFGSWGARLAAITDSARGLKYLHHESPVTIIHRDIKPPNILFDSEGTAKVADFGLAKEIDIKEQTHLSTAVSGTIGYLAPEYATSGKLTAKTDVFAFGVVILQTLTGKRPGEESLGDYGLAKWVHKTWKDNSMTAVLDRNLKYDPSEETQLIGTLRLGVMCSSKAPENRPTMDEVVYLLENLDIFEDDTGSVISMDSSSVASKAAGSNPNSGVGIPYVRGGDSSSGVSLRSISTDQSSFINTRSFGPVQPSNLPL